MNNLVGYLTYRLNLGCFAVTGDIGSVYNYITTGNGLAIQAENQHIWSRFIIAPAEVRGLPKIEDCSFTMKHGKIPQRLWDLALSVFLAEPDKERYAGIIWDPSTPLGINGGCHLFVPEQRGTGTRLEYQCGENVVLELHSHPGMGPFFSATDDKDEQGLKIYGVVGMEDVGGVEGLTLSVNLRLGVYGYFHPVAWGEVFEGRLGDVKDVVELDKKEEGQ